MRIHFLKTSSVILVLMGTVILFAGAYRLAQASMPVSNTATMTCIPVQQISRDQTQLECRLSSANGPNFLASEIGFPFNITRLIKVSSPYSAAIGLPYPTQVVDDMIYVAAVSWGDAQANPQMQVIPIDGLSVLVETDQSMKAVKAALESQGATIDYLSPNPTDATNPLYNTLVVDEAFWFDGSLLLEAFTTYVSPGVLQFLKLGESCYEQTPQVCLEKMIENLMIQNL